MSEFQGVGLNTVRPYLVVGDASAAIGFYSQVFDAVELERHVTPAGGVGHAKIRIGDAIIEIGEHPSAVGRVGLQLPRSVCASTSPTLTTRFVARSRPERRAMRRPIAPNRKHVPGRSTTRGA